KNKIFVYSLSPFAEQKNGPAFSGRESGATDCSLRITDLRLSDSGTYTLRMGGFLRNEMGDPQMMTVFLFHLQKSSPTQSCSQQNPYIVSVAWFWDGLPLRESSQMQLSDANRTLTIHGINRSDAGEYRCQVSNPASTEMSDAVYISLHLFASVGPETPEIQPNTSVYNEHSDIQLTCTASGEPAIVYTWFINGTKYSDGSQLLIRDISVEQSGTYLCKAVNKVTRDQKNTTLEIEVVGE
uniref:Ig-like domain-containing protein n=1 Tax=Podarcis muralis TaxID=64176 RepID=A0A670IU06_PODMU